MKNNYSKFMTIDEMQKELKKVSSEKEVSKGGIPLCYDESSIYLDEATGHNLIVGSTGSGKTQSVILPKVYTSILAGENLIIDDPKSQIYELFKEKLNDKGYKVIKLDFHEFNGNKWNPLKLAYDLYKGNNLDDAVMILEKIAYYVFKDSKNDSSDYFWVNTVMQLFTGTILYIMEKEDRLPTIKGVSDYASKITFEDFDKLDDNSPAKVFLRIIMTAPPETKGSIYSVFNSLIMCYSYSNKISEFLSENDFDLEELLGEKVAVFILDGHKKSYVTNLISLFVEELYYICDKNNNNRKINVILDEFNDFVAIDNFTKLLSDTRGSFIELTLLVNSLHNLSEIYGEIVLEHIVSYFTRIIYLFAGDEFTLDYISKMCGNVNDKECLISITELKLFKHFEALVLKSRLLPFRTKLLPYYQYNAK